MVACSSSFIKTLYSQENEIDKPPDSQMSSGYK